jgi:phenylalanyl-tRNA synthetase beta chain
MKISLNWLKEYVDIPKNITPKKLGKLLTLHSVEVEDVIDQAKGLDKIVVGKILEIKKHPNADKLKLAQVDIGESKSVPVVCGGTNLRVGMLVAFAKIGSQVRWHGEGDLVVLKKAKIRGEESEGMICTPIEIGLDQYQKGDTILMDLEEVLQDEKALKPGAPLAEAIGLDDVIIDIDNKTITHRPDLWGHYGIAREVAAILKLKIKNLKLKIDSKFKIQNSKFNLKIDIKNHKLCPRYQAVIVDNIKVEPSPLWMQARLTAVGVRPINNIVDITNYVMLELGQPLHAFDRNKLAGNKIIVRTAKEGEKITTLDGMTRKLDNKVLLITDEKQAIAIAGVMGGANSEVDDKTTSIIIESANFEPINNRQTSTKLGLRTEAAIRYEKSLDPNLTELAMNRVLDLIVEIIPQATIASKIVDQKKFKLNQGPIVLNTKYVQQKIGVKISPKEIKDILERLGFEVKTTPPTPPIRGETDVGDAPLIGGVRGGSSEDTIFQVKIPSWRATKDVSMVDDLVEEVARIYGFDKITPTMPKVAMEPPEINQARKFERQLKDILTSLGFDEVYNYAMVSKKQVEQLGRRADSYIKILNSLSLDYSLLRQSLVENLVVNIKDNSRYFDKFKIFEFGSAFFKQPGRYLAHPDRENKLPKQEKFIAGAVVDSGKTDAEIFFQAKEAVENLLTKIRIKDYQIRPSEDDCSARAEIAVNNNKIGMISGGIFEISFDKLFELPKSEIKYQPLAKFPEVKIDLAVVASREILWHNIEEEIRKAAGNQLKKIELFDVYEGKNIGPGKKNLAMHLSFGEDDRTMEMGEVEKLRDKIVARLKDKWGISIRG